MASAPATYDGDIVAWSREQARLLRAGDYGALDIEHIADEVEDVGKSEQRELASRMAVLLAHLLKWQLQPGRRGRSWELTIREQRTAIAIDLRRTPSLKASLSDPDWLSVAWLGGAAQAAREVPDLDPPDSCPWAMTDILRDGWMPG